MIEHSMVLARSDCPAAGAASTIAEANEAWARAKGHDSLASVALGEIVFILMSAGHSTTGRATLAEAAASALEAINTCWPEYGERMTSGQLEPVVAAWAADGRNSGKWTATAALLREAGLRTSNPKNAADMVRLEFGRWTKAPGGKSVRANLLRNLRPVPTGTSASRKTRGEGRGAGAAERN